MIRYRTLRKYLEKQKQYPVSVKKNYLVINVPNIDYHITIFEDQWNDYSKVSKKPYYLFHISSNQMEDRCSSYFWVNKHTNRIQNIPSKYFSYNQPSYSYFSSTRSPCKLRHLNKLLRIFQGLLDKLVKKLKK